MRPPRGERAGSSPPAPWSRRGIERQGLALREFADEKNPSTNDQKNAVIVYYMTEVLGMSGVSIGQVLTGYNECQWKPSSSPDATLRTTASKYRWIDTKAITTTHAGRAFVEYDLPSKKAAGS